jgi:PilZ domain
MEFEPNAASKFQGRSGHKTTPMSIEPMPGINAPDSANLRRATRYYFGGVVELTEVESGRMIVALVRSLSLCGCFVKTDQSPSLGAKLLLKMTHGGSHFSANGRVVHQTEIGIGVEFTDIDAVDRSRLEECLAELARTDKTA